MRTLIEEKKLKIINTTLNWIKEQNYKEPDRGIVLSPPVKIPYQSIVDEEINKDEAMLLIQSLAKNNYLSICKESEYTKQQLSSLQNYNDNEDLSFGELVGETMEAGYVTLERKEELKKEKAEEIKKNIQKLKEDLRAQKNEEKIYLFLRPDINALVKYKKALETKSAYQSEDERIAEHNKLIEQIPEPQVNWPASNLPSEAQFISEANAFKARENQTVLQREKFKMDRILQSREDKRVHALNTIIEHIEPDYPQKNNINIDYHYFNYEDRMVSSKLFEHFLKQLTQEGCIEKYSRSNYAGGTSFGFIGVDLEKIKKFRSKLKQEGGEKLDTVAQTAKNDSSVHKTLVEKNNQDVYFYNNRQIKISKEGLPYKVFDILFTQCGQEGFLSYEDIESKLVAKGLSASTDEKQRNKRINNAIVNEQQGFFKYAKVNGKSLINKTLKEDEKLVNIVRGKGLQLNNPQIAT